MTLEMVLRDMSQKAQSGKAGKEIQSLLHSKIVQQFGTLRKGGNDRGISWSYFNNPWYTRKDGTEVPIWGGVMRVDGTGKVKGKKRSKTKDGKKRYTSNSALMQSTGIMKGALLHDIQVGGDKIVLSTPVMYAVYQNAMRPFNYITDDEAEIIAGFVAARMK